MHLSFEWLVYYLQMAKYYSIFIIWAAQWAIYGVVTINVIASVFGAQPDQKEPICQLNLCAR